jgi:carboxypeptidase T
MKCFLLSLVVLGLMVSSAVGNEMLVRVYTDSYQNLKAAKLKTVNYAGGKLGEYLDIIVTEKEYYSNIVPTGLLSEVIYSDLDYATEKVRGQYHTYTEVRNILHDMAQTYSSICVFDSIGQTYEGRWIYCVKISDSPQAEDDTEPDVLIMGCHHAREWATVEAPLFIADSLTEAYSSNSTIKDVVDNREIWVVPCVNADGYEYDYPGGNWWRKNRQPYAGATGTDPNRTYNGSCNGDRYGEWGAIPSGGSVTHYPSNDVFCGPYGDDYNGNSAPCCASIGELVKAHEFNFTESFHSYGELVLWPWGYTYTNPPNNSQIVSYGNTTASMIHCLGSGYYDPGQSSSLYPTSGDSDGWIFGWYHYINGTNCVSFTNEIGTSFYQSTSDLDYICRQNFKGIFYMIQQAEDIRNNLDAEVPSPAIAQMDTSNTGDYTVSWSPRNPEHNDPTKWELHELTGFSSFTDDLETGAPDWNLDGFSLSTSRYHSTSHSFYSGSGDNISNTAITVYPYPVKSGDSLTFWCWYDLEDYYDVAVVEVSVEGLEWFQLDNSYTGNQSSWTRKSYSLEPWVGKSIFIRFRAMCDDYVLEEGFYVDDISPTADFANEVTVSNAITDTFYDITGKDNGTYWYKVRGSNAAYSWGSYSILEDIVVNLVDVAEEKEDKKPFSFSVCPNPFNTSTTISIPRLSEHQKSGLAETELNIYDLSGRLVKSFSLFSSHSSLVGNVSWDGKDNKGCRLPAGVYYVKLKSENKTLSKKLILLD